MSELNNIVRGRITLPGDAGFAQVVQPWNVAVDQTRAVAVVEAADAADVAALVRYAAGAGLPVTTQACGHGASGNVGGAILLRTGKLDTVEVDVPRRRATVGAGVRWGQVLTATSPHGLTGLVGSSPVVSVTGYTLGGGLSWFGRKHGLAADSVRAFDVVTAEGEQARVTAQSDADLFWALRGGGGDCAVVTSVEFDLHPVPELYGGRIVWQGHQAPAVLEAYREVIASAPDELSVWFSLLNFPGAPLMAAVDATYLGAAKDGQELLRHFEKIDAQLNDSRRRLAVDELPTITAEPTDPSPGISRSELLTDIGAQVEEALLSPLDPLSGIQVRHLGGALRTRFSEQFYLYAFGVPTSPQIATSVHARLDGLTAALGSHATGRKPFTALASGDRAAAAFSDADLTRLRDIKQAHDPKGVLRSNYPVGA